MKGEIASLGYSKGGEREGREGQIEGTRLKEAKLQD